MADSQSRKWQLTINNPMDKGWTHEKINETVNMLKSLVYHAMCDEIGEEGTPHTHIFISCRSAVRFSRIKKLFPEAHIEMANGTAQQNRDYIRKEGKWASTKKKETNLIETFEEYGEMPVERPGRRTDLEDLYDMIKSGMTNFQILEENPEYMLNVDKIERARQIIRENQYKSTFRKLDVTYIYGETGSGKTRGVMEEFGYENVYRVTNYLHPFDGYQGQDVIIFEEFRSSLKVQDMLNYLDGYPLVLPCRYSDKIACFTKVYIITNIDLAEQYKEVQKDYPETWRAFLRRLHRIKKYTSKGVEVQPVPYYTMPPDFEPVEEVENLPFSNEIATAEQLGIPDKNGDMPF